MKLDKDAAAAAAPDKAKTPNVLNEPRFAKMLEQGDLLRAEGLDPDDLVDLLGQPETAKSGDVEKLVRAQEIYHEQITHAKEMAGTITETNIEDMAATSPELQAAIKARGDKEIAGFVQKQLLEIAISDPVRFEAMRTDQRALESYKTAESGKLKAEFERINKESGLQLDMSNVARILNNPDPAVRTQELLNEIRAGLGFWKSLVSNQWRIAGELTTLGTNIEKSKAEIKNKTEGIGKLMGLMLDENADVRAALMMEIVGKSAEKLPQEMPLKDLYTILPTESQMDAAWETRKNTIPDWGRLNEYQKDVERANFEEEYSDKIKQQVAEKGEGLWARFALFLFGGSLKAKSFK